MRSAFIDVVGNDRLRERLRDELCGHNLSHAYILEGAPGTGKHTVALRIAMALACQQRDDENASLPCMSCPACRKILDGKSPDVIFVRREEDRATLGVETIREIRNDVYTAPNDLDTKVYILEDAHLMTPQAQNAFLLTLEEPPAYVLFLLLCESSANLLETVRSRAPTLRTQPVEKDLMARHLCDTVPEAASLQRNNPGELAELLMAAEGSIGQAKNLLDPKTRKPILLRRQTARDFVSLCTTHRNSLAVMQMLKALPQKREELITQLHTVLLCLRDLLLCKQTDEAPLCFFADREESFSLSYRFTTPQLLALCDRITEACDQLCTNANVRLALTTLAVNCGLLQV